MLRSQWLRFVLLATIAAGCLGPAVQPSQAAERAKAKRSDRRPATHDAQPAAAKEPTNFADARQRGQEALDRMQAAEEKDKLYRGEGNAQNHKQCMQEMAQARDEAIKYFRRALELASRETSNDDLNTVRYYLAYLYWSADQFYEAAVTGEFLARRYTDSAVAPAGARIAMAAYVKLFASARSGGDRKFEAERMTASAEFILKHWPGQPEADEALMILIRLAIVDNQLDKAREYLQRIRADSPQLGEAELTIGQALWAAYLRAARLPDDQRPKQAELETMIQQARSTLQNGIARMQKSLDEGGSVTATLLTSVLSLAQICIGTEDAEAAVRLLEDPRIGALTLVARNHPATQEGNFAVETYKAALRAYAGVQQLEKAEQAMNALEQIVKRQGDAEAEQRLTQIYIGLGRELQDHIERLRRRQKSEPLQKMLRGFELLLTRISQREAGNTFNSLNWVAETFFALASGFGAGGQKLEPEAENYYQKAVETYRAILKRCEADAKFAPTPEALTNVRIRLSKALRRLGQYKEALDLLVEVLKARNNMVDIQIEAAYTYQAWGDEKPGYYLLAIQGGRKAPGKDGAEVTLVWGWGKISKVLAGNPAHASLFHEARYNLALCRLKYALSLSGAEKEEMLKRAESDITILQRLYPDLGGPQWLARYDTLLKRIQQLRGVQPVGLPGTKAQTASPSGKAPTAQAAAAK